MKRLIVPAFAVVALIAAVAAAMWRPSTKLSAETGAMPSMQELHAGTDKLPNQEIEDQSLVFPNIAKRPATIGEAKR